MSTSNAKSNSRLTLSIQSNKSSYNPGDVVLANVSFNASPDYSAPLQLHLIGVAEVNIMGIDRWQAGAAANIGSGGSSMLITSIEALQFLRLPCDFISPDATIAQEAARSEKRGLSSNDCIAQAGLYQVIVPSIEGQILPTYLKNQDDLARVSVRYYLELTGERKGFLKKNDKLQFDIPVTIPRYSSKSDEPPSEITATRNLKFTSVEPLFVSATLSHRPLSHRVEMLTFNLTLTPSASAINLAQVPKITTTNLSRRIRTTPIDKPANGKEFEWAGINLVRGELTRIDDDSGIDKCDAARGIMRWEGQLKIPKGECTVESRGLGIRYMLGVQLSDPSYASTVSLKLPVFLPSSSDTLGEENGDVDPIEDQLPTYAR